jgi:shikimate dehydrogenase
MPGALQHRSPASLEGARPGALIVDIVYRPEETEFLAAARATGHPTLGGLPMLIYQGALAFELWTGVPAPVDVMFDAARGELANERRAPA